MKKILYFALSFVLLVCIVSCDGTINKMVFERNCIAFTATSGTVNIEMKSKSYGVKAPAVSLQYSYDGKQWLDFEVDKTKVSVQANDGNKTVYIQANNPNNSFSSILGDSFGHNYFTTSGDGKVDLSGNIMALLDKTGETVNLCQKNDYAFMMLFSDSDSDCTNIENAGSLILPATELSEGCYLQMFSNCISLKSAPALPATKLANDCYKEMFYYCTSLTSAPALPATKLTDGCYSEMFYNCIKLSSAPELPATELADSCYSYMFYGCTNLTTAPVLPATELADHCYSYMFYECKSLTTAPELPATALAEECYFIMFGYCTSLINAPALPATTLENDCYKQMFYSCTSLKSAPVLPATTLAPCCYVFMFGYCTSLTNPGIIGNGTDPVTLAQDSEYGCMLFMYYNCSSLAINSSNGTKFFVCPSNAGQTNYRNSVLYMFSDTVGHSTFTPTAGTTYYWTAE